VQGWLLLWLTDRAHKLVKGCLSLVPRLSASPAPSPPSPPTSPLLPPTALVVASASSPAASFDWVLYGAVRSVLYPLYAPTFYIVFHYHFLFIYLFIYWHSRFRFWFLFLFLYL
jgi:hypothetical protein